MKMFVAAIAACATALVWTAAPAGAAPGDPMPGLEIGLEHDSGGEATVKGTTDREGNVSFNQLKPGRYRIVVTDASKLKAPARVTVSGTGADAPLVSEPIAEGQPGSKAYALGKDGRWILTEIGAPSPQAGTAAKAISGTIKVRVESTR